MSLTLIILLFGLIKMSIAATMLLVPLRHDAAMRVDRRSASSEDDGGLRSGGDDGRGPRPRWPVTGEPSGPRRDSRTTTPLRRRRGRGAHTPPVPLGPRRTRSPLPRRRRLPIAR
jgi:hypothetical protein